MESSPDIVVVGAGHAGCEAALAAARLGRSVLVVTLRADHVGRLSCNPAVGGLAKGHIVREIDALGGAMARVADASTIQFRRLNTRKGLAVQASRAQVDIARYPEQMQRELARWSNVTVIEGEVESLLTQGDRVRGVSLRDGTELLASRVILTTGTFLGGIMHRGHSRTAGGRVNDPAAGSLSASLKSLGLSLGRLKTGTTPRLDASSIDWSRVQVQQDTVVGGHFSFTPPRERLPRKDCHVAYTTEETHALIRESLHESPLFTGAVTGRGPRYCPSIEDKVVRFAERSRHQLFLEPEGLDTERVYVAGLSTSLPDHVQLRVVQSIPGLENARILQYGYAVEYDFSDPRDLGHDLQHRGISGLYLAGQLNGTSGYEEAAGQGLVAGVSAALGDVFRLGRDESYIGVLVDDLVTRGVGGEPYRMFSSRAEHRLLLREDNADRRLMPRAHELGLLQPDVWARFEAKRASIESALAWCGQAEIRPTDAVCEQFARLGQARPKSKMDAAEVLRRPEADWETVRALWDDAPDLTGDVSEQVVTDIKYEGYLRREKSRAAHSRRMSGVRLPEDLDYRRLGLSSEVAERLCAARPLDLGAAARLPGITPAAIDILAVHLSRGRAR